MSSCICLLPSIKILYRFVPTIGRWLAVCGPQGSTKNYIDEIRKTMITGIIARILIYQATCLNIVLWWIDVLEVTPALGTALRSGRCMASAHLWEQNCLRPMVRMLPRRDTGTAYPLLKASSVNCQTSIMSWHVMSCLYSCLESRSCFSGHKSNLPKLS